MVHTMDIETCAKKGKQTATDFDKINPCFRMKVYQFIMHITLALTEFRPQCIYHYMPSTTS